MMDPGVLRMRGKLYSMGELSKSRAMLEAPGLDTFICNYPLVQGFWICAGGHVIQHITLKT